MASLLKTCTRFSMPKHYTTFVDESLPRITVPQKMVQKYHDIMTKRAIKEARGQKIKFKSPLIVSCKRQEYNHHKGQTYARTGERTLASRGWMHRKSAGDHFTLMCHQANPAVSTDHASFSSLGLSAGLCRGLRDQLGVSAPTNIQRLAVPKILTGHNSLCIAETGSGKTYSYLLPIIELIDRQQGLPRSTDLNAPRFVVLVPAHEIAAQIKTVADGLSNISPLTTRVYCGQQNRADAIRSSKETTDILVSTPGALDSLLRFKAVSPSQLQLIVLDEVDTLMDDSFNSTVRSILQRLKFTCGSPSGEWQIVSLGMQVVLVGATMPRNLHAIIGDHIPTEGLEHITTDHAHRLMPHVPQKFVRVLPSTKPETLLRLVKSSKRGVPTMIFCNKGRTACWLSQFLDSNGVTNIAIHGSNRAGMFERFQTGDCDVLVATDVCSRGLDTLRAQHVINYEFPDFVSDYIHRVGRVGRVGAHGAGHVTSFVSHKWEVEQVWSIEASARQSTELFNVNANIKRKLTGIIQKKFRGEENWDSGDM